MPKRYDEADDAIVARIMGQRRSVRDFSGEVPEKGDIEKIVHAGLMAPYAAAAIQNTEGFRKFVAIKGTSPKTSKINELIKDIERTPYEGMGKPEPLKYDLAGLWSRRIDREHRLVYRVVENEILIYSCRYHYD